MYTKIVKQIKNVVLWPEKKQISTSLDSVQMQEESQRVAIKKRENKRLIEGLVKKSNRILLSVSTRAFPFKLFRDTINIEEGRVTIITRNFLYSSQVHSIDIKDISNIFMNVAPFFAQLEIVSNTYEKNLIRIRYLDKNDAVQVRRIIEGLRIFESKKIDASGFSLEELVAKLEELSTTEVVT